MTKRVQKQKRASSEAPQPQEQDAPVKDASALKAELDDLLEEIDTVLEENAADFVREYIQRGGE